MSVAVSTPSQEEKTFRSFTKDQGKDYAKYRRDYHPSLYQQIIDYHTSKGGELGTLVDIGCGPGIAVRTFAKSFAHAIGIDASEGMINTARSLGGETSTSEPIRFEVSTDFGASLGIPDGSVDVITVATAAHWFDMSMFWKQAAKLLGPGGTVAIWGGGNPRVLEPTPNREAIMAAITELRSQIEEFNEEGNRMSEDLYAKLAMPWTVEPAVVEFEKAKSKRVEWGTDRPGSLPADEFYAVHPPVDMKTLEMIMGTGSPVIRWREANPEKVGTEEDVVRKMRRAIERALHEAGVKEGEWVLHGGVEGVLLLFGK